MNTEVTEAVPTTEDVITDLRQKLSDAAVKVNNLTQASDNQSKAILAQNSQVKHLMANVEALTEQRDHLLSREADALVDKHLLKVQHEEITASMQKQVNDVISANNPDRAHVQQLENSLNEVRTKFGALKHQAKGLEREQEQQEKELNLHINAMEWFAKIAAQDKSNFAKTFESVTGSPISAEVICTAFQESWPPVKGMQDKINLRETLVSAWEQIEDQDNLSDADKPEKKKAV